MLLLVAGSHAPSAAGGLTIEFRGSLPLGDTSIDQNGVAFTVTGLSGVVHQGGRKLLAVMDNSNKLVSIQFVLENDGTLKAAQLGAGLSLAQARDFEGLALMGDGDSVFLAEEDTPQVHHHRLSDGALLESLPVPSVFRAMRLNRGFESCTFSRYRKGIWVANEEALTVDGPESSTTNVTVVRLLRFDNSGAQPLPAEQFAYEVEPVHAGADNNFAVSGLVDLVALPGGGLLALERSFNLVAAPFLTRIFEVDFEGATDVSGFPALDGATYTPVTKRLLWSGNLGNLEGLALGPVLEGGGWALLGVVDDGDALNENTLVAFRLQ